MSQIINLRTTRKQAARDSKRRAASENAARHGRSKLVRTLEEARATRADRNLDGHKLDKE
ncbi:MAG: DUF4169 family protein [Rhodobacteraceae bacterium]|nr:MAG: DUF4169 family protein [Paracoccaceae bacterium]